MSSNHLFLLDAKLKKRSAVLFSLFSLFSLSACVRISAGITAATQVGWCGDDDNEVNELLTCGGPKQSTKGPPASGSTCKTSIQCVKTWLSQKIELFAVIMTLFLFLET
jgi:hypothetical protein